MVNPRKQATPGPFGPGVMTRTLPRSSLLKACDAGDETLFKKMVVPKTFLLP